jgi:hypothetical protein
MSPFNQLSSTFDKKWTSYVLAGGAMFMLPAVSRATPIFELYSPGAGDVQSAGLDVDGDTVVDFNFFADGTPGARNTHVTGTGVNQIVIDTPPFSAYARALQPGTIVDGTLNFGSTGVFRQDKESFKKPHALKEKGEWSNDINHSSYLGLQFQISGETHYGWAAVSVALGSASLNVNEVAYESEANTGIQIPNAVPEPTSMALMLLGAGGIALLKKRRASGN